MHPLSQQRACRPHGRPLASPICYHDELESVLVCWVGVVLLYRNPCTSFVAGWIVDEGTNFDGGRFRGVGGVQEQKEDEAEQR